VKMSLKKFVKRMTGIMGDTNRCTRSNTSTRKGHDYSVELRMRRLLVLLPLAIVLMLIGCDAEYRDVSSEPKYATRVGERCVVLKGLRAYGFTKDLRRKDLTHGVDITTVAIGGPEYTFEVPISKGIPMEVTGVRQCVNCPFEERIDYAVVVPGVPELSNLKVFARAEALAPEEVQCTKSR
jgi:hypothetical protein